MATASDSDGNFSATDDDKVGPARGFTDSNTKPKGVEPKIFSYAEVQRHNNSQQGYWIIVGDKVYDCTKYIRKHPGGPDWIIKVGGTDATIDFLEEPHLHTKKAHRHLRKFYIGDLNHMDVKQLVVERRKRMEKIERKTKRSTSKSTLTSIKEKRRSDKRRGSDRSKDGKPRHERSTSELSSSLHSRSSLKSNLIRSDRDIEGRSKKKERRKHSRSSFTSEKDDKVKSGGKTYVDPFSEEEANDIIVMDDYVPDQFHATTNVVSYESWIKSLEAINKKQSSLSVVVPEGPANEEDKKQVNSTNDEGAVLSKNGSNLDDEINKTLSTPTKESSDTDVTSEMVASMISKNLAFGQDIGSKIILAARLFPELKGELHILHDQLFDGPKPPSNWSLQSKMKDETKAKFSLSGGWLRRVNVERFGDDDKIESRQIVRSEVFIKELFGKEEQEDSDERKEEPFVCSGWMLISPTLDNSEWISAIEASINVRETAQYREAMHMMFAVGAVMCSRIKTSSRWYLGHRYENCVVALEIVEWIENQFRFDEFQAVEFANALVNACIIRHVTGDYLFSAGVGLALFFQFSDEIRRQAKNYGNNSGSCNVSHAYNADANGIPRRNSIYHNATSGNESSRRSSNDAIGIPRRNSIYHNAASGNESSRRSSNCSAYFDANGAGSSSRRGSMCSVYYDANGTMSRRGTMEMGHAPRRGSLCSIYHDVAEHDWVEDKFDTTQVNSEVPPTFLIDFSAMENDDESAAGNQQDNEKSYIQDDKEESPIISVSKNLSKADDIEPSSIKNDCRLNLRAISETSISEDANLTVAEKLSKYGIQQHKLNVSPIADQQNDAFDTQHKQQETSNTFVTTSTIVTASIDVNTTKNVANDGNTISNMQDNERLDPSNIFLGKVKENNVDGDNELSHVQDDVIGDTPNILDSINLVKKNSREPITIQDDATDDDNELSNAPNSRKDGGSRMSLSTNIVGTASTDVNAIKDDAANSDDEPPNMQNNKEQLPPSMSLSVNPVKPKSIELSAIEDDGANGDNRKSNIQDDVQQDEIQNNSDSANAMNDAANSDGKPHSVHNDKKQKSFSLSLSVNTVEPRPNELNVIEDGVADNKKPSNMQGNVRQETQNTSTSTNAAEDISHEPNITDDHLQGERQ